MTNELEQFKQERNTALLSLDEHTIRAHHMKWSKTRLPDNPTSFWGGIHKTITSIPDLPFDFRKKSKAWLDANGLMSWDDGDL